jgi:hypothetical protein
MGGAENLSKGCWDLLTQQNGVRPDEGSLKDQSDPSAIAIYSPHTLIDMGLSPFPSLDVRDCLDFHPLVCF